MKYIVRKISQGPFLEKNLMFYRKQKHRIGSVSKAREARYPLFALL